MTCLALLDLPPSCSNPLPLTSGLRWRPRERERFTQELTLVFSVGRDRDTALRRPHPFSLGETAILRDRFLAYRSPGRTREDLLLRTPGSGPPAGPRSESAANRPIVGLAGRMLIGRPCAKAANSRNESKPVRLSSSTNPALEMTRTPDLSRRVQRASRAGR